MFSIALKCQQLQSPLGQLSTCVFLPLVKCTRGAHEHSPAHLDVHARKHTQPFTRKHASKCIHKHTFSLTAPKPRHPDRPPPTLTGPHYSLSVFVCDSSQSLWLLMCRLIYKDGIHANPNSLFPTNAPVRTRGAHSFPPGCQPRTTGQQHALRGNRPKDCLMCEFLPGAVQLCFCSLFLYTWE